MGNLKVDLINGAYSRMRVSGLTNKPSPEDIKLALQRLEDMAAMWFGRNVNAGYFFEDQPDPSTPHNVQPRFRSAFEANLAMLLLADFGKDPKPTLVAEANATLSNLFAGTAKVANVEYPDRMPLGSGNSYRVDKLRHFYPTISPESASSSINNMISGNINDYATHFDYYLRQGETITTFTIASSEPSRVSVSNSAVSGSDVGYRGTAGDEGNAVISITITTSLGRIETRNTIFKVSL
jgi:P22 tail accessory factor